MLETGRIRIAKDKAELVKSLTTIDAGNGPFSTFADAIAFAAALGVKYQQRVPLGEISRREPGPIGMEIFVSRGYDLFIKQVGITATEDIHLLSTSGNGEGKGLQVIFEEYANGGLEILQEKLRGAVDYSERILLILSGERFPTHPVEEFDLRKFL